MKGGREARREGRGVCMRGGIIIIIIIIITITIFINVIIIIIINIPRDRATEERAYARECERADKDNKRERGIGERWNA